MHADVTGWAGGLSSADLGPSEGDVPTITLTGRDQPEGAGEV
jgi:hypothetical protein